MNLYYSKKGLYNEVAKIKEELGMWRNAYNFNIIDYCINDGTHVEIVPFKTPGLRGMAAIGNKEQGDIILLNSHRNKTEQNFDCAHEVVHLYLHRYIGQNTFNCFDTVRHTQNPYLEWHANEGAAEMFVPYKIFLPLVKEKIGNSTDYHIIEKARYELASIFNVPETVIRLRLENLKYEIQQYMNGVPLEEVEILSLKKQQLKGLKIDSINTLADNDFNEQFSAWVASRHQVYSTEEYIPFYDTNEFIY